VQEIVYFGYNVSGGKVCVSTKKVAAVKKWSVTKTQREVRSFVQFYNFYAKFIHDFSDLSARR
jgi:hypothetical protein